MVPRAAAATWNRFGSLTWAWLRCPMVEQLQKAWTAPPALLACLASDQHHHKRQPSERHKRDRAKQGGQHRAWAQARGANLTPTRPGRALAKRWLGGLVCQQWRQCRKRGRKARWGE
jgi:hypothetical protein